MDKQAFISYASEDAEKATSICKLLEQHDVHCWIAPRDITPGASYAEEIIKAIERTQALVLVMSENANNSPHVGLEVERAVSKAKTIFPVRIRECTPSKRLEYFVSGSQWIDAWASPLEIKVSQLANAIKALSETGRVTGTGEWKLGHERTFSKTDEPSTLRGEQATAEIPPLTRSKSRMGVAVGALFGLIALLGAGFYYTRSIEVAVAPRPRPAPPTVVALNTPAQASVAAAPSSSFASNQTSSVQSQPAETELSLAIAKSIRDAEQKIFSSIPTAASSSSITTAYNSQGTDVFPHPVPYNSLSSQQSFAYSSSPVIDPTLPLPLSSSSIAKEVSVDRSSVVQSSSSAVSVASAVVPAPEPKVVPKPKPTTPKPPVYATVRSAKVAYRAGTITKSKYREIVSKLEDAYDTRVRQLKLDYRAGKITRDEYGRQVRALKERYYG